MSEPVRILVRVGGLLLFLAGLAGVIALFVPGPTELAEWMGQSCSQSRGDFTRQCTVLDVLSILISAPLAMLIGGVLALAMGPSGREPRTLDLSRLRRRR